MSKRNFLEAPIVRVIPLDSIKEILVYPNVFQET